MRLSIFLSFIFRLFLSCSKTEIIPPEPLPILPLGDTTSSLTIKINNVAGNNKIVPIVGKYTTLVGDTFTVKVLKYYFTNIALTNQYGIVYKLPDSYFLIDISDSLSTLITLRNVPADNYRNVSFLIGVDAEKNTAGAQTGALDPMHGMFWSWNTGYIMAKMEGTSPQSGNIAKDLSFHIGGFSGKHNGVRGVSLLLPLYATVSQGHRPRIVLSADIAKWFSGAGTIDFSSVYSIGNINADSELMADNYARMFSVTDVIKINRFINL